MKDAKAHHGNKSTDLGGISPHAKSAAYVGYDVAAEEMERSFATEKVGGRYGELSLLADDLSQGKHAEDQVLLLDHDLLGASPGKERPNAQR